MPPAAAGEAAAGEAAAGETVTADAPPAVPAAGTEAGPTAPAPATDAAATPVAPVPDVEARPASPPPVGEEPVAPAPRPAPAPVHDRGPNRALVGAVVAAVVLLLLGALAWRAATDEEGPGDGGTASAPTPEPPPTTGAQARGDTSHQAGVPADWVEYTDATVGYRIAHPPGWQVQRLDRTRTDFKDPATGAYLRVDWTDRPGDSPEADWERQSRSFGARHAGYREIRVEPATYRDYKAAIWEYAYSAGNARLHAVDLGFIAGDHGFALNFQTPEALWERSQPTFEAFKAAFRPPS